MDRMALRIGNALLGNPDGAAGIEVALFPFRVLFQSGTAFSVTGADCTASLEGERLPPNWTRQAAPGQTLKLSAPTRGARAYLTFLGGIDVPLILGSRSTDQKGGFGGLQGRGLQRGDQLRLLQNPLAEADFGERGLGAAVKGFCCRDAAASANVVKVRVLRAAEYLAFGCDAHRAFLSTSWQVTPHSNRMGYRLKGPALLPQRQVELLSHGIVPGTVQVPPSGEPIVQLADANTCGGYPKFATVIEADLGLLAQAPLGSRVRFAETDRGTAVAALREQAAWLSKLRKVLRWV
jgi:5-oxoprolinase (ATP-hydrolysing) subunit C